jgi:hypothetical protein
MQMLTFSPANLVNNRKFCKRYEWLLFSVVSSMRCNISRFSSGSKIFLKRLIACSSLTVSKFREQAKLSLIFNGTHLPEVRELSVVFF